MAASRPDRHRPYINESLPATRSPRRARVGALGATAFSRRGVGKSMAWWEWLPCLRRVLATTPPIRWGINLTPKEGPYVRASRTPAARPPRVAFFAPACARKPSSRRVDLACAVLRCPCGAAHLRDRPAPSQEAHSSHRHLKQLRWPPGTCRGGHKRGRSPDHYLTDFSSPVALTPQAV